MTTYKKILNIALPAMVENFLQMLMGMVDSYLVASLGLVAISGVSVAGNMISIYQAIFIALGSAVSSLISKSLGEGDRDNLAYHTSEAIKLTLSNVASQIRNGMSDIILRHGKNWNLCDRAFLPYQTSRTLIQSG